MTPARAGRRGCALKGAYYNENDKHAAAWLRQLIAAGLIPAGDVDERSICDVQGDDLAGYVQCHFFAGIGGWAYALRLAGWPDDREVWTGSCPCQPYSVAGQGKGDADERNLWPAFFSLIQNRTRKRGPVTIFGEQVAAAIGKGWLDGISTDLETEGYAVGAAVLGSHSVNAPHIRQRLYWVADTANDRRREGSQDKRGGVQGSESQEERLRSLYSSTDGGLANSDQGECGRLADSEGCERNGQASKRIESNGVAECSGTIGWVGDSHGNRPSSRSETTETNGHGCTIVANGTTGGMEHPDSPGRGELRRSVSVDAQQLAAQCPGSGFWSNFDTIPCADGKTRRIESGTFPLAHGIPARVVRLRGYGNAINPHTAAEFITAYQECMI